MGNNDSEAFEKETGDEGYLVGIAGIAEWQVAWPRVIALSWQTWNETGDARYLNKFKENPREELRKLGYHLADGLELNVVEKFVPYDPNLTGPDGKRVNGWLGHVPEMAGSVTMVMPQPPEDSVQPIALVDYDAAGKSLPFTC